MWKGGAGGKSSEDGRVEEDSVWTAAGVEYARAASARQRASLDACWHAWTGQGRGAGSIAKAIAANGRAAAATGGRAGRRGALAEAGAEMQRGMDAIEGSAVEFSQAAKLSGMAADWWNKAEYAFAMGRQGERARAADGRSAEARSMAKAMRQYAVRSRASARKMKSAIGEWAASTAAWGDFDGPVVGGEGDGRRAWLARRDEMLGAANDSRADAEEMARRTTASARLVDVEGARLAADSKALTAGAIGRLSEGLDAPEAAAALRKGMEAASMAVQDR